MLTSQQNERVKLVRQLLKHSNEREEAGLFVAEGLRLTDDFLGAGMRAHFAFISPQPAAQEWRVDHPEVDCIDVSDAVMDSVSVETTAPGVLVVFHLPVREPADSAKSVPDLILILDAIKEPGNLGACLRVAAGSACRLVLLSPGCVDPYNPKVVRGGMGAHARLQLVSATWDHIHWLCKDRPVWAADAHGDSLYDAVNWTTPTALIIGSESTGLSAEARGLASGIVSIPLANHVESLNAAVACGVVLFEAARQRRQIEKMRDQ